VKHYRKIHLPDHPLAGSLGYVLEHRSVLFEKIGPGEHRCNWCGCVVVWSVDRRGNTGNCLIADHLDEDITNNYPANLVPSCNACNRLRGKGWRIKEGEIFILDSEGYRIRAELFSCGNCTVEFAARPSKYIKKKGDLRFCSKRCQALYREKLKRPTGNQV
jgi:hypothetical protein